MSDSNIVRLIGPSNARTDRLRREDVISAALDLLDEGGIAALSMRRLASQLGVQAASLYHHVASKRHLLAAMADEIVGAAVGGVEHEEWNVALAASAHRLRAALRAHRDGAQVVASTVSVGRNTMALARQWAGVLGGIGLSSKQQVLVALTLFSYVLGHVLDEDSADGWDPAGFSRATKGEPFAAISEADRALALAYFEVATDVSGARFEAGLDLLLAGVRHQMNEAR